MEKPFFKIDDILPKVLEILGRDVKSAEDDVDVLKKWMQSQPHLPEVLESKVLLNFLIQNKFSIERSKQKIDMYYTVRSKLPDIYDKINPTLPEMQKVSKTIYAVFHRELTKEMYRVFFFKVREKALVPLLEPGEASRYIINLQELRMREDICFGDVAVLDFGGTLPLLLKLTPTAVYKSIVLIYKVNGLFNEVKKCPHSQFAKIEQILALLKKLVLAKIFERIHICSSVDELKNIFPPSFLPKDFGGEERTLEELREIWETKLKDNQELFDHLDKVRVDESLRPEKLKDDEVLGFYGNFKKFEVD